ncbi:Zn-ribbon domain-containing OB-fold protein [Mycobacterium shimoidei]|uniref:Zn-ribbon domain-containing OB-fold protein n=1 Tax=Mycobacterium shimoidei TaxID=29313 RepID=UPI0008483845|nr:OB-fold domain-containing protein [Mycobacterium shimoidei]MCV7257221.1 OB-fold domain-containing protein [Mycobacterium shimoidei]ODR14436.1 DNA-binding protein [Mycobacterium shimoidei]ORW80512.1 DNA-binding protein [Mycobacterium shimoidei]
MSEAIQQRPVPVLTELNRPYWTGGADGTWRLQRCLDCERLVHPPALRCPHDHGVLEYVALSGRGRVETWTVNEHPFFPGFAPPYLVAFVNPVEDSRVRVLTNVVNVRPEDVTVGMPVRVIFERHTDGGDEVFIPLFEPDL